MYQTKETHKDRVCLSKLSIPAEIPHGSPWSSLLAKIQFKGFWSTSASSIHITKKKWANIPKIHPSITLFIKGPFQGGASFVDHFCYFCLVLLCFHGQLFVYTLWSPGKGLTSLFSFVMSNCDVVTFPLVSCVRCGA